jgi:23S rRNA-/tRNA-specific pseudouridylate synthase
LGDPLYGGTDAAFPHVTLMLHAKRLSINLPDEDSFPPNGTLSTFKSPLPIRFRLLMKKLDQY